MDMKQRNRLLGRIDQDDTNTKRSRYDFVLFKNEIESETIEVIVIRRESDVEHRLSVNVADVAWAFGNKSLMEWEFRRSVTRRGEGPDAVRAVQKERICAGGDGSRIE